MRRTVSTMICLILISNICNCQEKAGSIGLNLTSLIFHTAELGISYGFCRQWSISAETAINLNGIWKDKEYLEKEHADEFNDRHELISPEDRHRESIYISFWPDAVYSGTYLSAGARFGETSGYDCVAGVGYVARIWKGLLFGIDLRAGVQEIIRAGKFPPHGLSITIRYVF